MIFILKIWECCKRIEGCAQGDGFFWFGENWFTPRRSEQDGDDHTKENHGNLEQTVSLPPARQPASSGEGPFCCDRGKVQLYIISVKFDHKKSSNNKLFISNVLWKLQTIKDS